MTAKRHRKTRRITLPTADRPGPAPREKVAPVVVEVAADGFVTIYGPPHVRVKVFDRLDVDDDPPTIRADMTSLTDLFHELELPRTHRPYYWPRHIRAVHMPKRRTLEGERRQREALEVVRGCREIREALLEQKKERATA